MKKIILLIFLFTSFFGLSQTPIYQELYRPQYHFTPAKNWINDPNGLVYYKGNYHLFYQYNPFGNIWGHMSWGHAISTDLLHWQHLPVALQEQNGIMIFSGSAVADEKNTSGFGNQSKPPLVAIYTGHTDSLQTQNLAFSNDDGFSWTKYNGNPVLNEHKKDFRDPNVFWYAPEQKWIMSLSYPIEHQIAFYASTDLKTWKKMSVFGPAGDITAVWECPDLMQVPIADSLGKKKWVLFTSQNATMQYFVGDFNGASFINESPASKIFKQDYGNDYYAAVTYHTTPDSIPVSIGWINNWNYANSIPTTPWKGAMSIPRRLSVKKINNEWRLIQQPIANINSLRKNSFQLSHAIVDGELPIEFTGNCFEADLVFQPTVNRKCGIKLVVGKGSELIVSYNADTKEMEIDRSRTQTNFDKSFAALSKTSASVNMQNKKLRWHIFIDKSIIEVFVNDGSTVFTTQFFSSEKNQGITLFSEDGKMIVDELKIWNMQSIWNNK